MNEIEQLKKLHDTTSELYKLKLMIFNFIEEKYLLLKNSESNLSEYLEDKNYFHDIELTYIFNKNGDISSNFCLKFSRFFKIPPVELGNEFIEFFENLRDHDSFVSEMIESILVIAPGFINILIKKEYLIKNVLFINRDFGKWELAYDEGKFVRKQVNLEAGSANAFKALSVGHIRNAITAVSLSKLLKNLGFDVVHTNFPSDIGLTAAKALWGAMKKDILSCDFFGSNLEKQITFLTDAYVFANKEYKESEEVKAEIHSINLSLYRKDNTELYSLYEKLVEISLRYHTESFGLIGLRHDATYPESSVLTIAKETVEQHIGKVFFKDDGAIIFRGKDYGLSNWVFLTKENLPTYGAKDLGLAVKKFQDYPDTFFGIVLTSTEQKDYFKAVIKTASLCMPEIEGRYYHFSYGWVLRGNKKMSTRTGNIVSVIDTFRDAYNLALKKVSDEKGYSEKEKKDIANISMFAGIKFLFLSREMHMDINYNPKEFLDPEGFSGNYLLYSYVRAKHVIHLSRQKLEKSEAKLNPDIKNKNYILEYLNSLLDNISTHSENLNPKSIDNLSKSFSEYLYLFLNGLSETELILLQSIYKFPQVTFVAGTSLAPHLVANYAFNIAQQFNRFYRESRVVEGEQINLFRLLITSSLLVVLQKCLDLLGIEVLEKM